MSVIASGQAIYYPLPDLSSAKNNGGLIGRWHDYGLVTGDASGGFIAYTAILGAAAGVVGPYALFDVRSVSLLIAPNLGASNSIWVIVYASEALHSIQPSWRARLCSTFDSATLGQSWNDANAGGHNAALPRMKWSIAKQPPYTGNVTMYLSTNVNLSTFEFDLGGYIYDERYIQAD